MFQNIASRSFGSNQVPFGGMIPPASAMIIKSSMLEHREQRSIQFRQIQDLFSRSALGDVKWAEPSARSGFVLFTTESSLFFGKLRGSPTCKLSGEQGVGGARVGIGRKG
jgi:hypothetical protein